MSFTEASRRAPASQVTGTPAFFIKCWLLSGAQMLERFDRVIKDELERAR
jgi:predicted DsbA family dithiol-disulfide isomerase